MNARFVKNPINGLENDALWVDGILFDVDSIWDSIWYAGNHGMEYGEFYDLFPAQMAVIALELFEAGMIDEII